MARRNGITLIECVVVVAIVAVLIALAVPAVQRVRQYAARTQDQSQMKQIVLALHHYASMNQARLPGEAVPSTLGASPFANILPFLDVSGNPPYQTQVPSGWQSAFITIFISPTDPSIQTAEFAEANAPASYVWNYQVFCGTPSLVASVPDGASNTIAISQHYYITSDRANTLSYWWLTLDTNGLLIYTGTRSASFADPSWLDVVPETQGLPPESLPSRPNVTFQAAPSQADADGTVLQATQPFGLLVGMLDGSVRTYAPSVSCPVFWAAVTPAGGETISDQ